MSNPVHLCAAPPRRGRARLGAAALTGLLLLAPAGCTDDDGDNEPRNKSATGGETNPICDARSSQGDVQAPEFRYNLQGQTSWYASPLIQDLDGDGDNELIAAYYSVYVFDSGGELLAELDGGEGRVYAPHVVADLDGDGTTEIVYGSGHEVYAYEWIGGEPQLKAG